MYTEFLDDVIVEAEAAGLLQSEAFFNLFADAAINSGDIEGIEYCPVLKTGSRGYRIDGYNLNSEQGELVLAICDYRPEPELPALNAALVETFFSRALRFFERSLDTDFVNSVEDSGPAGQAAHLIYENRTSIRRLRIVIFSNARIAIRKDLVTSRLNDGIRISLSILDFERYEKIQTSRNGVDPIEIDLTKEEFGPLPCLEASAPSTEYSSYLVVVPARILADIYGTFGARLLEANVRTFLQARTKVNKGMQITLRDEPQNFLAYNNGLTATASAVEIIRTETGTSISSISDLQIVNGGQTTASILYARDKEKVDLENVFVQMKLSVVDQEAAERIVPNISRFANSQNKISAADFFASHPFHLQVERMSRRISAPPAEGSMVATKWFYERARGQYNDAQAFKTQAERRKFQLEHPKEKKVDKTDLAKYEMTFNGLPNLVSRGAQKCFLEYAARIDRQWDPEALKFGDGFFRDAMARALIFRWTDKMIGTSDWYKNDRGYKAQTVTYTLAAMADAIAGKGYVIDYRRIWNLQDVPASMQELLGNLAPRVSAVIKNPPPNVRNIGEYCKTQACWAHVQRDTGDDPFIDLLQDCILPVSDAKEQTKDDRKTRKIDSGIECQKQVFELGADKWKAVLDFCAKQKIVTPRELSILEICSRIPAKLPSEKQCVIAMTAKEKAEEEGFAI